MASLLTWTGSYGPYLQFYLQILFWIVLGVAALWAALSFSRYVKFMTGAAEEAEEELSAVSQSGTNPIAVDQFVD